MPNRPLSFPKALRLLTANDFEQVFSKSDYRASHRHFLILAIPNQHSEPRLGLVIAKKHIRLAVERNRIKRLIRESFRHQQHQLSGIDAIVLARKGLDQLDNKAINNTLDKLWRKIQLKACS
ncbi:MAG: ribonuclease P protein component [Cellvibrionaceae bacterium]